MTFIVSEPVETGPTDALITDARSRFLPIIQRIALTSKTARQVLGRLADLLNRSEGDAPNPWLALWREHSVQYYDLDAAEDMLAHTVPAAPGSRLFLVQSYCKLTLMECAALTIGSSIRQLRASFFDWLEFVSEREIAELRHAIRTELEGKTNYGQFSAIEASDFIASLYQEILPPAVRHLTGEYYTPSWLVEHSISSVEATFRPARDEITIFDPAAGAGSFLCHYLWHIADRKLSSRVNLVGFDINPLAVDFCATNLAIAASRANRVNPSLNVTLDIRLVDSVVDPISAGDAPLLDHQHEPEIAIQRKKMASNILRDLIGDRFLSFAAGADNIFELAYQYIQDAFSGLDSVNADLIVGNPPWITWDGLLPRYRAKMAPQWSSSTLLVTTGWRAKVSAGKTDFSSLFVYRGAERHAAPNALLSFVLPLSLFQSRLAGAGFRKFRTARGRTFPLIRLDDLSSIKVFPDAANRSAAAVFAVDRPVKYPVDYITWKARPTASDSVMRTRLLGGPLDVSDLTSPIVAFDKGSDRLRTVVGKSDYRARGGVNTGGANTILWLNVLEQRGATCIVQNVGRSRRSSSPVVTGEIETSAVFPLLGGTDVVRWAATPSRNILLLYSADQPKQAMPQAAVERKFPLALNYVSNFETALRARKEYHRWGCSGPFYEVYRIGPYTFSEIKVVWQHTGYRKALNVSVIDDRNRHITIPDQKVILIPFDDLEEAHYVCALLASSSTSSLLDRYLGTDASTHIMDYLAVRRFQARNFDHKRLAELSMAAHAAPREGARLTQLELEIDDVVASLLRNANM